MWKRLRPKYHPVHVMRKSSRPKYHHAPLCRGNPEQRISIHSLPWLNSRCPDTTIWTVQIILFYRLSIRNPRISLHLHCQGNSLNSSDSYSIAWAFRIHACHYIDIAKATIWTVQIILLYFLSIHNPRISLAPRQQSEQFRFLRSTSRAFIIHVFQYAKATIWTVQIHLVYLLSIRKTSFCRDRLTCRPCWNRNGLFSGTS